MKNKLLYGLIAGVTVMAGLSSCNNEEFLDVTHYSILVNLGYMKARQPNSSPR